ncbi:uncharacterized protein LOC128960965 [Oppia nitens]|uniref:uncharacterized protein LOC128960965 n=1 Tax=Oppia nitens TaxID=1686743 RepID=UPI0023DA3E2A|nr:uncharacterized protein LOC128960965 [Oppia nitens]
MTTIIDDLLSTDSYIELEQMIMRSQIDQLNDVSDEPLDDLTFDLMDDNFIFGDNCITAEPVANEAIPVNINDVNAMTTFTTLTSAVTIFDDICDIGIDLQFIDKLYEECPSTVNSTDLITNDLNSYNDRAFDTKPIDDKQQSAYQSFNADLMINDTDGLIFGHSYSKQKTTIEDLFPQTSATNIQNNSSSETAKRKRGRPRRMPIVEQNVIKRRRGRPSLEPEVKEIRKKIRETKASAKYRFKKKMEINIILSKKKRLETMIAKNTDIICLIKDKLMSCLPFLYNNLHFINQDVSYIRNIKSLCN